MDGDHETTEQNITSTMAACVRQCIRNKIQNTLLIHEGNTKQISTMTVTLYLIKLIDVRKEYE